MGVTVYTQNGCPQCRMTKVVLGQIGQDYEEINVSTLGDDEIRTRSYLKDTLGFRSFPVVVTDAEAWCGFRPEKIKALKGESDGKSL